MKEESISSETEEAESCRPGSEVANMSKKLDAQEEIKDWDKDGESFASSQECDTYQNIIEELDDLNLDSEEYSVFAQRNHEWVTVEEGEFNDMARFEQVRIANAPKSLLEYFSGDELGHENILERYFSQFDFYEHIHGFQVKTDRATWIQSRKIIVLYFARTGAEITNHKQWALDELNNRVIRDKNNIYKMISTDNEELSEFKPRGRNNNLRGCDFILCQINKPLKFWVIKLVKPKDKNSSTNYISFDPDYLTELLDKRTLECIQAGTIPKRRSITSIMQCYQFEITKGIRRSRLLDIIIHSNYLNKDAFNYIVRTFARDYKIKLEKGSSYTAGKKFRKGMKCFCQYIS
ncbi:unnamed protein product [Moneuplotes crassus]|uniref:Uncharacterized protein n=1 Tax=Euplotes crassus TaxID=5936 RepID=A0AAD1X307_EUPCR|nr:unnamed protein product [Moneuplotes crassus]